MKFVHTIPENGHEDELLNIIPDTVDHAEKFEVRVACRRALDFARDYSNSLLAIDVNISTDEMLDTAWALFRKYFNRSELGIKKDIADRYGHFDNE